MSRFLSLRKLTKIEQYIKLLLIILCLKMYIIYIIID